MDLQMSKACIRKEREPIHYTCILKRPKKAYFSTCIPFTLTSTYISMSASSGLEYIQNNLTVYSGENLKKERTRRERGTLLQNSIPI